MSDNRDIERIRQKQIAARDPGSSKIKGYDWAKHASKKQPKRRNLYIQFFYDLPHRIKGLAMGFVAGTAIALIGSAFVTGDWQILLLIPILIASIIGFVIGGVIGKQMEP